MKAAVFRGKETIELEDRPDPTIEQPTDAIVRTVMACVCGSDLWYYRGVMDRAAGSPIGHEFIGIVEQVGDDVKELTIGDLVIAPFLYSDGTCAHCEVGMTANCEHGGGWGSDKTDGGQGEYLRVPYADGTLVTVPKADYLDDIMASLLSLSDVMCTGRQCRRQSW